MFIDGHDISGVQPAVGKLLAFVITIRDPRTANQKFAGLAAIPRDFAALAIDSLSLPMICPATG